MITDSEPKTGEDIVVLTVPANVGYLGVLRTATAGLAARLQFGLDDIEDLRIAVDEACAMLLAIAVPGAELECRFSVVDDSFSVEVTTATVRDAQLPPATSFAWKVLTALTTVANAEAEVDRATIHLLARPAPPR